MARRMLPVLAALIAAAPASAAAPPPVVHELKASPLLPGQSLRVPGRSPAPRFRRDWGARASSIRVLNSAEDGTRTNGKILGVDPVEGPYSCSGTALNTPSRSIVLTAGHCVIEKGSEGRRISFVPAYDHGSRPFGTFRAQSVFVMPQWRQSENPDFDVAALRVRPNALGALTDVVGGRGFATSKSRLGAFQIFGYPAAWAGGEELRSCRAHGLGIDRLTDVFGGPPTMPASCDMAAGSSGGAWLFDGDTVSGVTSYSYQGRPTQLFSPYFGPQIGGFLRQLP
ncbi:MAG TPA: trypsin-like serine protease [Solirubrobacterales bacterium]|nr:trypsin-like serine protease [Solirubrobacterales bacterium]